MIFFKDDFNNCLNDIDFYNNRLIYVIKDGKDTVVNDLYNTFSSYVEGIQKELEQKSVVKIQGIETYSGPVFEYCRNLYTKWNRPVDCHAYWGYEGTGSFKMHSDPYDVEIMVQHGTKRIYIADENTYQDIKELESQYIPANIPHRAENITDCLSLSFSCYSFVREEGKSISDVGIKL